MPVRVLTVPLSIQLPANGLGSPAKDSSHVCAPAHMWEIWVEVPGFRLAGLSPAVAAIWGVKQQIKDVSVLKSDFQSKLSKHK